MQIITAPSKTQQAIKQTCSFCTIPSFFEDSRQLIEILKGFSLEELCQLMKMSSALGDLTRKRIHEFELPFSPENACQALFTFQGDAYNSLTPERYSEQELLHAQQHLRILSGLYGLLRPLDLIQPYRLEMATRLQTKQGETLYQFWGNKITDQINREMADDSDQTLVNLASQEYARVIQKKVLQPRFLTVTFKERKGKGYKTIPIHSKRARGLMMHYAIIRKVTTAEELQGFDLAGYSYCEELSTAAEWIFTRKQG